MDRPHPSDDVIWTTLWALPGRADTVENAMEITLNKALMHTILEHAQDYAWTMQDISLLGLRLDDRGEYRLHV